MRVNSLGDQIRIGCVSLALVLCLVSAVPANEVWWIDGVTSPGAWSIQPQDPQEGDVIEFSGSTHIHLNQCIAERAFGGKPTLQVDTAQREVRLVFVPTGNSQCTTFWEPVCGLRGSFGPLPAGSWVFLCTQGAAAFTLPFEVRSASPETVYYVDARAVGAGNGSSWADAFVNLQNALDAVHGETEIRVARGVYRPSEGAHPAIVSYEANFALANGVILKGGYAGISGVNPDARDVVAYATILSGDLKSNDDPRARRQGLLSHASRTDNSRHILTAVGADITATLDGFIIQGGNAYIPGRVEDLGCGGGLYLDSANLTLRRCTIVNNSAAYYGGGLYARGAGSLHFLDCTIADNWSDWRGGGMHEDWDCRVQMDRCIIRGNGTVYEGGGLVNNADGEVILANCLLSGNMATSREAGRGGAIYCLFAGVILNQCTFVGNSATQGSAVACVDAKEGQGVEVSLSNCLLWDSGTILWTNDGFKPVVTYSDVQGGWSGQGNRNVDPNFLNPGYWDQNGTPKDVSDDIWHDGNYRLGYESPCVDAGDPTRQPDSGEMDLDGSARLCGQAVDMGAYELFDDRPVAIAGPDVTTFSLDGGPVTVTLDGSASRDPSGLAIFHRWYQDGKPVSSAARFTVALPTGRYDFTLVVSNSAGVSRTDEVIVTIMAIHPTATYVSPNELGRLATDALITAMVVVPQSIAAFDGAESMLLFPGGARAQTQTTLVWLDGKTYAMAQFRAAELLAAVPENGTVEVRVVGRLKNGLYFGGTDTIKIR